MLILNDDINKYILITTTERTQSQNYSFLLILKTKFCILIFQTLS